MRSNQDLFGTRGTFDTGAGPAVIYRLQRLEASGFGPLSRLPYTIRVLLENALRNADGRRVTEADVRAIAAWSPKLERRSEIPFLPARVVLQDMSGIPVVADLAALRAAVGQAGGRPEQVDATIPTDLVVDHSVQVDAYGSPDAARINIEHEYERNQERYAFLKWAQQAFQNLRVVPPGTGIIHQVNLEALSPGVHLRSDEAGQVALLDSVLGTDSHTTMINGLGVLGWGVGGIEAEAVMLGQPYYLLLPEVIGVKLMGRLPEGVTATDLVLTVTKLLRQKGVVEKFVEFYGPGVKELSLPDRATLANMAPEYGATVGFFPVDEVTLAYLRATGRTEAQVNLVERYTREQALFFTSDSPEPTYTDTLLFDLSTVKPSVAGPSRPQQLTPLGQMKESFRSFLKEVAPSSRSRSSLKDGAVAIAAITSCTNTSNPSVLIGAGLVAKRAVALGLQVPPYVKTSLTPGSRVVGDYLEAAQLMSSLESLGFHIAGHGCATCMGASGDLTPMVTEAIRTDGTVVASVLSGNRNFEGRVHPLVRANYLASPMLVVAYALAGTVDIDLDCEPLGFGHNGLPVYLADLWPTSQEIQQAFEAAVTPAMFRERYGKLYDGDHYWQAVPSTYGTSFAWDPVSTYLLEPPFLQIATAGATAISDARALAVLGDYITTDHISPVAPIPQESPAGIYLRSLSVCPEDLNSYGSRRGNHEVMMRGTFGNIRLKNRLVEGKEGGWTRHQPTGELMTIYDAAVRYREGAVPLIILAGKEYGTGSSRDWAAKGTALLGVRAVIAEGYERIHRSNLVGSGVLPLQFSPGESMESLGLTGQEAYTVSGLEPLVQPNQNATVVATGSDGRTVRFTVTARLDSLVEVDCFKDGGILPSVLKSMT